MEAEVIIRLNRAGQITISGPIEQKLLVLGMLEAGKETLLNWHAEQRQKANSIEVAPRDLLGRLARG